MEFIETPLFTRCITALLSDEAYWKLQAVLEKNPEAGDLIPAGGGLRKIRWRISGRGKRGGTRVIYYCWSENRLVMYYAYDKMEQGDLTPGQLKALRAIVKGGAP